MKKIILIILVVFTLIISGCSFKKMILSENFKINTDEIDVCNNEIKEYYSDQESTIYLYCLKEVNLVEKEKYFPLKEYINNNNLTIESVITKIVSKLTLKSSAFDGGTSIYKDNENNKKTNNGITIVKCNTLEGNKDIYIGPNLMDIEIDFCQ